MPQPVVEMPSSSTTAPFFNHDMYYNQMMHQRPHGPHGPYMIPVPPPYMTQQCPPARPIPPFHPHLQQQPVYQQGAAPTQQAPPPTSEALTRLQNEINNMKIEQSREDRLALQPAPSEQAEIFRAPTRLVVVDGCLQEKEGSVYKLSPSDNKAIWNTWDEVAVRNPDREEFFQGKRTQDLKDKFNQFVDAPRMPPPFSISKMKSTVW